MNNTREILVAAGISPTPVRLLVYKCLASKGIPMSLSDLEIALDTVDKSTISRTLSTFKDHHLLHAFNDGSGSVKYEICFSKNHDLENDRHVHFRCINCGETICLTTIKIPEITLPEGFLANDMSFVVTGLCNNCSDKK